MLARSREAVLEEEDPYIKGDASDGYSSRPVYQMLERFCCEIKIRRKKECLNNIYLKSA